jgi:signal transduction histidine kinase
MGSNRGAPRRARKSRWPTFLAAGLLAAASIAATEKPSPGRASGSGKSVLIVHAEDPYLPWVSEISAGIYEVLEAAPPAVRPDIYVENLDLARFPELGHAGARAAWLREKYSRQKFDAILVVTKGGLDVADPLARELWPEVPIVLLENESVVRGVAFPPGVVPILARFEIAETVDLARELLPGTKRIAFVSGAPDFEINETEYVRRELATSGLELIDLVGLPMPELERRIAALPEDTIVLYWGIRLDGSGQPWIPREALRRFAPFSNRPIFTVHATMLGYGLTGGRLFDFAELGREAGRTVLRILEGEPPVFAPIRKSLSHLGFDARKLRRFGIPAFRLPKGSRVAFEEQSVWSRYPGTIAAILAALIFQGVLIAALLLERRRRSAAQARTQATLASLPGQVAVLDRDGHVAQVNDNWAALGAAGDVGPAGGVAVGENYVSVWKRAAASGGSVLAQGLRMVQDVLEGARPRGVLEYPLRESERPRWYEMRVETLLPEDRGAVVVQTDITQGHEADTELRMRDREIAHLNRVGAVGELASSLAHELGQPLGAILTNAQAVRRLLTRESPDMRDVRESINDIIADDQRAGEVIQRMRSLLRKEETPRDAVDLNEIVRTVLRLVAGDASLRQASVEQDLAPSVPPVIGDSVQLKQVVLNLVINGLDAVADRPVGDRSVKVSTCIADGHLQLSVRDSGPGLREPDLARVFEPFYTTKTHGLGMGLSICRTIVEAHGGEIRASNAPGGGAAFDCDFPIASGAPS